MAISTAGGIDLFARETRPCLYSSPSPSSSHGHSPLSLLFHKKKTTTKRSFAIQCPRGRRLPLGSLALGPESALEPAAAKSTKKKTKKRYFVIHAIQEGKEGGGGGAGGGVGDLVKTIGQYLWGNGLPPGALVGVARSAWTAGWMVMMKQLAPSDADGAYKRPGSQFRSAPFPSPARGRYHLYAALSCPWAHRAIIVHTLKGLGDAVPLSIAVPGSSGLWEFRSHLPDQVAATKQDTLTPTEDRAGRRQYLKEIYSSQEGGYNGRATMPMLWDSEQRRVVNNESADIIKILNSDFNELAANPKLDLAPKALEGEMEKFNSLIYTNINNGVYRCGMAQSQDAYESAANSLFSTLDTLEEHLMSSRYLCGNAFTLADIRLFTTLIRFDTVYNILFKCSKQKLSEYPNLYGYVREIYQMPGIAATCNLEEIMDAYYKNLFPLNPGGIRPITPVSFEMSTLLLPHNRENVLSQATLAGAS